MSEHRFFDPLALWRSLLVLGIVVGAAVLVASWRGSSPPPPNVGALYEEGLAAYQDGDFERAADVLKRAYAINDVDVGVNTLLGWSHWRLGQVKEARFHFERALEHNPSSVDARTGLGFTSLALGDLATARPVLEQLAQAVPNDRDVSLSLANAYVRSGDNLKAAGVYRAMLARNPDDADAQREFLGLFGYAEYRSDLAVDLPPKRRPEATERHFRTLGDYVQAYEGGQWRDVYMVGSNLGPARPGEYPSTVSREHATYARWLREMADMHSNTVRVYTILPPAFYQALADHNRTATQPIWLLQGVWIHDDARDLYDPHIEELFTTDLGHVIDLLHGQGNVPYRPGGQHGIYRADVSRWVIGLAVGREIEPHLALRTNARNAARTSHAGRYVSLQRGNPTEAWLARMCDRAVQYELDTYNAVRPIAIVTWPPLDPMTHASEATFVEEVAIRQARGEPVTLDGFVLPDFGNDTDAVTVDIMKLRAEPAFAGGLFALSHVYQHWPDFMFQEPAYAEARDAQGMNRYLGYLRALKQAHPNIPLLIGEYGLAASIGIAHLHPEGWHNGGFTEKTQAALLDRFTRNHHDTRMAGSIVFAWKDEWWKKVADLFTSEFEIPRERDPLWLNVLDPEEVFGIVGYEPETTVPLLRGRDEDWSGATMLATAADEGPVRAVRAMADFAYLYLRLDLSPGQPDWSRSEYWVALNTVPAQAGTRRLPGVPVRLASGANFLVQLGGPGAARVQVSENYWPNGRVPIAGANGETRVARRTPMAAAIAEAAPFVDMITEANARRFGRDGTFFPAQYANRSPLPHGTADRSSPEFSDHALWRADPERGMVELRLPWALLLVADPSSRQAFAAVDERGVPQAKTTPGVSVAVFAVAVAAGGGERQVLGSLPALSGTNAIGPSPLYAWPTWNEVRARQYFKPAYYSLGRLFAQLAPRAGGS